MKPTPKTNVRPEIDRGWKQAQSGQLLSVEEVREDLAKKNGFGSGHARNETWDDGAKT